MNTLRYAKRGQRTCALHPEQHRIVGRWTESISTYGGRRVGQGGHGNLHKDGSQIEHVDCTRSGTYEKLLSVFWTNERWSQEK